MNNRILKARLVEAKMSPSKILFTADTHLSHYNILAYTSRPFPTTREMDDTLLSNISSMVKGDTTMTR